MRGERGWAGASTLLAVVLLATACGGSDPAPRAPAPRMAAEVVQLRRDEVLKRVQVAVTNRSADPVTIDSVELRVPGFSGGGPVAEQEPLPAGQLVDLPTSYGRIRCTTDGRARVGRPTIVVRVHTATDPTPQRVVVRSPSSRPLLQRIATRECVVRQLAREVSLSFGPSWRRAGAGADTTVHGTLVARLRAGQPKDLTQLAGTVIYDLAADPPVRPEGAPLLRLTPDHPDGSLGIVVSRSRCDGHARGETKQPYAFLVWVGPPGTAGIAVTPTVTAADRAAFQLVCPL